MKTIPTFYSAGLLAMMLSWLAPAAGAADASIQIIAFSYNGAERDLTIADAKGTPLASQPLKLPTNQCSPSLSVSSRDLQFTMVAETRTPAPAASLGTLSGSSKPSQPTPVGKPMQVSLPSTGKDFVLVFLPQTSEVGGGYKIHAVELPAERFKSGSYAFLNYTDTEIYCGLDKQKLVVAPAKAGILSPDTAEGIVRTACFQKAGNAWAERPFFSGRVPVQQGVRNLVLVSRDPASGRIDFRGVADFVSP